MEAAQILERAPQSQAVEFDVYIPLQNRAALEQLEVAQHTPGNAQYHKWLTPSEFNARFAPDRATIDKISRELSAHGLAVTETHTHSLHVTGNVQAVERTFGTELSRAEFSSGRQILAATKPMVLTPALASTHAVVPRFAGVIHMRAHAMRTDHVLPANRESPVGGYWFDDLKQAYDFPSYKNYTGKGVTIGILMEAGYSASDTEAYFAHEKLTAPTITEIDLYGATPYSKKNPFNSAETQLDIQQSGGMAPGASIIHYNLPDLYDDVILAALTVILEGNGQVPGNVADVVNMSFGGPELGYTPPYNNGSDETGFLTIYDDMFAQGNAQGISFVASSGDIGALGIPPIACFEPGATSACGSWIYGVQTPAASPHVTGVGGTNLVTTYAPPSLNSAYVSEAEFDDPLTADPYYGTPVTGSLWASGGGISSFYSAPVYQSLVQTGSTMRTVPDLSLHMGGCPYGSVQPCGPDRSYDWVGIAGKFYGYVGTSCSAPDFTGLTALKIQLTGGRLGNQNYEIYALAASQAAGGATVFRTDIQGYNGYSTHPGYNYVLGNGTLYAKTFMGAGSVKPAGIPQTVTNP
jgi:subtilase family serine protease